MMSGAPRLHLFLVGGLVVLPLGENGVFTAVLDVAAQDVGVDGGGLRTDRATECGVGLIVVLESAVRG